VQSNCISIEPVESEFGRKRRINQSSCNKDYSCLKGYCPSFVTVHGGKLRKAGLTAVSGVSDDLLAGLPPAPVADAERPLNVLVAGIGGTGVVTVGALLGMAAHLEGKGCSVLDVTGLAQKNGPVTSHVRIANDPRALFATRIGAGGADLVLGCDIVVSAGAPVLATIAKGRTLVVANDHVAPTADFASNPDLDLSGRALAEGLHRSAGEQACHFLPATQLATALFGDAIAANLFLLGYALQLGRIPVGLAALERAIELNGRAAETNKRALAWGRLAAHDYAAVERVARPALRPAEAAPAESLEAVVARRVEFLRDYQDAAYARRYADLVERAAARERERAPGRSGLALAVARYYFKLLAYKDEYEVARLWSDGSFRAQLSREFESWQRIELHLAPQIMNPRDPDTGRARKWALGPWVFTLLGLMARFKFLRGTPFDPFGWTAHRRRERELIREYERTLAELLDGLSPETHVLAVEIASMPELIRGFDLVKDRHLEAAEAKQAELLAALRRA
jgi:indolepyruvate ferredoxin oxidoreductase